ncbi:5-deoxy-glucuronate isomerase [Nitriliruptor alkaliphilus]|uniref:5-deoxy-glucuronate isomerase n=1 Tax=Nitriliruptor alkaliphilus TaxID=427918 RepID=UPI0006968BE4|nr:5-deoxy-glucuronate isomerase [Nitriliruptor alkaliphilus]
MTRPPLHHPAGALARNGFALDVDPDAAGWGYSSLRVAALETGGSQTLATGEDEVVVLPLEGSCVVDIDGEKHELQGRSGVFAAVSDFVYAPRESTVTITSRDGGRFAIPGARARRRLPARYVPASDVAVELRGAGPASRQVVNFCTPDRFEADRLIACEVYTPGGNWSSYPPHKHDEERPGEETALEEIYYFEVGDGPTGPGMAYQRVYGTDDRPIDVLAEVRTGDIVLIPHGWHGPSVAVPGYDLYYLNVMAGPGAERAWRICDDPVHAWIRETWQDEPVDPRLPLTGPAPSE